MSIVKQCVSGRAKTRRQISGLRDPCLSASWNRSTVGRRWNQPTLDGVFMGTDFMCGCHSFIQLRFTDVASVPGPLLGLEMMTLTVYP